MSVRELPLEKHEVRALRNQVNHQIHRLNTALNELTAVRSTQKAMGALVGAPAATTGATTGATVGAHYGGARHDAQRRLPLHGLYLTNATTVRAIYIGVRGEDAIVRALATLRDAAAEGQLETAIRRPATRAFGLTLQVRAHTMYLSGDEGETEYVGRVELADDGVGGGGVFRAAPIVTPYAGWLDDGALVAVLFDDGTYVAEDRDDQGAFSLQVIDELRREAWELVDTYMAAPALPVTGRPRRISGKWQLAASVRVDARRSASVAMTARYDNGAVENMTPIVVSTWNSGNGFAPARGPPE